MMNPDRLSRATPPTGKGVVDINKIGLLAVDDGRMLLVRKRGLSALILPGGKLEQEESAQDCVRREICEELGDNVTVDGVRHVGDYEDIAATDDPSERRTLRISLYQGTLVGRPTASSEIAELVWLDVADFDKPHVQTSLSPILKNKIIPDLIERGLLAG
jgi:8-oxo-dGTP diphosphatase